MQKKILLSIVHGPEAVMDMDELTAITDYIQEKVGEDGEMIFGHSVDNQLKESIRVTVIATGFSELKQDTPSTQEQVESTVPSANNTENAQTIQQAQHTHNTLLDTNPEQRTSISTPDYKPKEIRKQPPTIAKNTANKHALSSYNNTLDTLSLPFDLLEDKKRSLLEKAQARIQEFENKKGQQLSIDLLETYLETPAYVRRGIRLVQCDDIPEKNIILYHLNENMQEKQASHTVF